MQADAEAVAGAADYPSFHDDLTARHRELIRWGREHTERIQDDPRFYDTEMAGWWAWGKSLWIGGQWADIGQDKPTNGIPAFPKPNRTDKPDNGDAGQGVNVQRKDLPKGDGQRPGIYHKTGGYGVQAQRKNLPKGDGKRPGIYHKTGGYGVQAQRKNLPKGDGKRPGGMRNTHDAGQGVSAHRKTLPTDGIPHIPSARPHGAANGQGVMPQRKTSSTSDLVGDGARLLPWFLALQRRLQNVFVLNRDWSSAVTPTLLQHTPSSPKPPVGVFLDPPYRTDTGRSTALYSGDQEATDVAVAAFDWAVEHGGTFRIAYACHEGDFDVPEGWTAQTMSMGHAREGAVDMVMFSPACVGARQGKLM